MEVIENKNKVITYLSAIKTNVEMFNLIGYYDIDRELENIVAKLLNLIYGDKFIMLMKKTKNFQLLI
ncbi:MAG: SMEK domain-containing protein [Clostridia bacterium]|nr:SMEK domain-containing protein [Clostridia bacterium]